ncbi:MAG TPA: putative baseplate assembly protein, partial [Anaerolinea sp.]|nr:putative baseplate assembly protein [Anaerolinea sp.]
RFRLNQSPVTYLSADTPSGTMSTLQVRVNDLLWQEAPSLYGQAEGAQTYAARLDDDGKTSVQFGDGLSGARPPSGSDNIVAVYRIGSGKAGNLAAGQISLLQSRPLGLKAVTNPLPATGGDDPEPRDQARRNAPMTTLTLDRLVSLQDYEDFSRAFAGIAKAQAAWLWDGAQRCVYITVAGPDGLAVKPGERTYDSLTQAIQRYGLPYQPFQVVSYTPLRFALQARVEVDPRRTSEIVLAEVRTALHAAFGFEARGLASGVASSQVLAVIQGVAGVVMADLNTLHLSGAAALTSLPLPPLRAQPARRDSAGIVRPAELLTLDDNQVELIEVI